MIKLAVFDVDGTLVSRGDRILRPSTIEALHTLKKQGIHLAIASGRPPFAMEQRLLDQMDFDYFICSNGCSVVDRNFTSISKDAFSKTEVEALMHEFQRSDNALMFQFEDKAYVYYGLKRIKGMVEKFLGRLDILVDDCEHRRRHHKSLPYAAVAHIDAKDIKHFEATFPRLNFEAFTEDHYDIYPKGISKATGIALISAPLNVSMDEVICFGDGLNDVEMIKACGLSVAMGDGVQEAKDNATYITDTSVDDGIYNALVHYNLLKEG